MLNAKISFILLVAATLAACSSDPKSFLRSPSAIKNNLYSLEGQSVDAAIRKMGLPKQEGMIAGRKILVWYNATGSRTSSVGMVTPITTDFIAISTLSRTFDCVVSAVVEGDTIRSIQIESNSVYYCPGQRK